MTEGDGIPDVEEDEEMEPEEIIHETMFTFEAFEMVSFVDFSVLYITRSFAYSLIAQKFAHAEITHTLLTYLARYKEFDSSENVKRVVSLMHRQVVRAKAEGLYFNVRLRGWQWVFLCLTLTLTLVAGIDSRPLQNDTR